VARPDKGVDGDASQGRIVTTDEFEEALHAAVGRPRAEMRTRTVGRFVTKELVREPGAHRTSWAQAYVKLGYPQTIKLIVNLNLKQGDLSSADYARLSNLALAGIRRYWSRTVRIANIPFSVEVLAAQDLRNGISAQLRIAKGQEYERSNNVAVLWIDARFIYNAGFFEGSVYGDQDFMQTCAHEFGHSVLTEFGGIARSWTHEGSTSIFQSTTRLTPGYPKTGEINLMNYYDEKKGKASFDRIFADTRASEFDLLCLLWMSRLAF